MFEHKDHTHWNQCQAKHTTVTTHGTYYLSSTQASS